MTNKCPHCASENIIDVSGYYLCKTCNKWYSQKDEPKIKIKQEKVEMKDFLDDEELGLQPKAI